MHERPAPVPQPDEPRRSRLGRSFGPSVLTALAVVVVVLVTVGRVAPIGPLGALVLLLVVWLVVLTAMLRWRAPARRG
jgi:hypothetical protein